jgi:hypothetical protein
MVNELINEDMSCWNLQKLKENFVAPDVVSISGIPIGRFTDDFWAWSQEKSGNFTVRSCYRLMVSIQQQDDHPSVIENADGGKFC